MLTQNLFLILLIGLFARINCQIKICTGRENVYCKLLESETSDFQCVHVRDSVDCMLKMLNKEADVGVFPAENALIAAQKQFIGETSRVVAEIRKTVLENQNFEFQTVVLVKKSYEPGTLDNLRGKRYCHPGFNRERYWTDAVYKEFERRVLFLNEECDETKTIHEQELDKLSSFFGPSCRPGLWNLNEHNDKILKQKFSSLCEICDQPASCSYAKPITENKYNELDCLTKGKGDFAYTSLESVQSYFQLLNSEPIEGENPSDYQYLCPNGTVQNLAAKSPCTWVQQPWPLVISSSEKVNDVSNKFKAAFDEVDSKSWKENLKNIISTPDEKVKMQQFDLKTIDYMRNGRPVVNASKTCHKSIKWCTKNPTEQLKCNVIKTAANTHGIKPPFECVQGSVTECPKMLYNNQSDIAAIQTNYGYPVRRYWGLTPAMFIESEKVGNYYGIILTKRSSDLKTFEDLKGRRACFPMYNGLGWLTYVDTLRNKSLVPNSLCADSEEYSAFFKETCAPGALNTFISTKSKSYHKQLCSGCDNVKKVPGNCNLSPDNIFFNEVGALRCLHHGAGDVAFVNYNAITTFFDSNRTASDALIKKEDFQVICKDNTKRNFTNLDTTLCPWTKVIGAEIIQAEKSISTARSRNIRYALEQLNYWFGTNNRQHVFKMFESFNNTENVLIPGTPVQIVKYYDTDSTYVQDYKLLINNTDKCTRSNAFMTTSSTTYLVLPLLFLFASIADL